MQLDGFLFGGDSAADGARNEPDSLTCQVIATAVSLKQPCLSRQNLEVPILIQDENGYLEDWMAQARLHHALLPCTCMRWWL